MGPRSEIVLGGPEVKLPVFNDRVPRLAMGPIIVGVDRHESQRRLIFMEFLSDEWYLEANNALGGLKVDDHDLVVAHLTDTSSHSIIFRDGRVSIAPGAESATVLMKQTTATMTAVRNGTLSALTAIQEGHIEVQGDVRALLAASEALRAVDETLSSISS